MSSIKFIVSHQDQQLGPFDEDDLKRQWEDGALLGIDYVYDEAKQDWVLLAERFAWAAAGQLDDTLPVQIQPLAPTEEIVLEPRPQRRTEDDDSTSVIAAGPHQAAEVKFTDGRGEVALAAFAPGHVTLKLNHPELGAQEYDLEVVASEPVRVRWTVPNRRVVGEDYDLRFEVVDANDAVCVGFEGEFTVVISGDAQKRHDVKTIDGVGRVRLSETKAQTWSVHLEKRVPVSLVLPAKSKMEWCAGPAARFVLEGPTEYQAGIPLKVQVKALDRFGNLASDFQGVIVLDAKAS